MKKPKKKKVIMYEGLPIKEWIEKQRVKNTEMDKFYEEIIKRNYQVTLIATDPPGEN